MARRKRGRAGAAAHVARVQVGTRDDVSLKRDAKAERVGARARLGDGLTDADANLHAAMREAKARGYLTPRSTREERAAWHALANEGWNA